LNGLREAFATAVGLHQSGRAAEAERLYRQIVQTDPRHCDALHMLGVLAMQVGRYEAAVDLIGRAIAENGRVPAFHNNLGNALKGWGRGEAALAAYGKALTCAPAHSGAHYNLAVTLQDLGRTGEAASSYRRTLALQPDHVEAEHNLGTLLAAAGDWTRAVIHYRRALAGRPRHADALYNLGNVLALQGRDREAALLFEKALSFQPSHAKSLYGLGLIRLRLAQAAEAASFHRRAIVAGPDSADAYIALGRALDEAGYHEEALKACRRAALLRPDSAEAELAVTMAAIPIAPGTEMESLEASDRFMTALDGLEAWDAAHPGRLGGVIGFSQPFHLAYRPSDVTAPLVRYGGLAGKAASAFWTIPTWQKRSGGKIRLGVISGQVRTHPVWDMLVKGIVADLDRERFELFLYHTGSVIDAETEWARRAADAFFQGPLPTRGWLDRLSEDRPDILVYPEIGMDPVSSVLAALRLAPVQAASWGHPVTTGLPSIDLFFSGELLEGAGADAHYSERLIRLPGTGVCTGPAPAASIRWEGAKRGALKFALCQQPLKFDPAHDRLLARIARHAGPCEFWLANSRTHAWASDRLLARLAAAFRAEGLDPDLHLRRFSWMDREGFNGFLDAMDISLDCPAFSGYTTAWQAIQRGLPIVTLEGEFLRQRLASGLLRQIGETSGICQTEEAYLKAALGRPDRIAPETASLANGNRKAVTAFAEALISALA
jgi:predicted O-linked N-acetylglucosamine transferase (SPINDLY family)